MSIFTAYSMINQCLFDDIFGLKDSWTGICLTLLPHSINKGENCIRNFQSRSYVTRYTAWNLALENMVSSFLN